MNDKVADGENHGWLARLKSGLAKSSAKLASGIADAFRSGRIDERSLDELEETLIAADLGVHGAAALRAALVRRRLPADANARAVRAMLAEEIAAILAPVARPLLHRSGLKPQVILVCGVNGSGKTTSIAKLAHRFKTQGLRVRLAAADTFRAAAIEQLQIWGQRAGCPVVAGAPGGDAAGVAFEAFEQARREGDDVLIIDTAGRLQNKTDLMAELGKMLRVIRKLDASAPHDCLLVLDATIGQNAISQVEAFRAIAEVSGLVLTKLDGTARGGIVVALAEQFGLPVVALGVGEGIDDLRPFEAEAFARALLGLDAER